MKHQIFISYRREDGLAVAKYFYKSFMKSGFYSFFDEKSIRNGPFEPVIYKAIDECQDFVLIVSEQAFKKDMDKEDWIYRELSYALEKKKNIIPVILYDIDTLKANLPMNFKYLTEINGIIWSQEKNPLPKIFELIISKPKHFRKIKMISKDNKLVQEYRKGVKIAIFPFVLYNVFLFGIRFVGLSDSSEMPYIIWYFCHGMSELSLWELLGVYLIGVIIIVFVIRGTQYLMGVDFLINEENLENINCDILNWYCEMIFRIIARVCPEKYLKSKEFIDEMFDQLDEKSTFLIQDQRTTLLYGMTVISNDGEKVDYLTIDMKVWSKIKVCGIGRRTIRRVAVRGLSMYGFELKKKRKDYLYFKQRESDLKIRIYYKGIWPEIIEVTREIEGFIEVHKGKILTDNINGSLNENIQVISLTNDDEISKKYEVLECVEYLQELYAILKSLDVQDKQEYIYIYKIDKEGYRLPENAIITNNIYRLFENGQIVNKD